MLSELEGAVMLEVQMRGRETAFQVRKAFANSTTSDWSGSAGAIYPAIKRLEEKGYILRTKMDDARGTHKLSLTKTGVSALHDWATDPILAISLGADPFRTRSDYLNALPQSEKKTAFAAIRKGLVESLESMDAVIKADGKMKIQANTLVQMTLSSHLMWIDEK